MKVSQKPWFHRLGLLVLLFVVGSVSGAACGRDKKQTAEQVDRVKLAIADPGIYRVTVDELRDAGLDLTDLEAQRPALTTGGQSIPYLIDSDAIIFYGAAADSRFANVKSYIVATDAEGVLMRQANAVSSDGPEVKAVHQTIHLEENRFYDPRAIQPGVEEVWFWETIRN